MSEKAFWFLVEASGEVPGNVTVLELEPVLLDVDLSQPYRDFPASYPESPPTESWLHEVSNWGKGGKFNWLRNAMELLLDVLLQLEVWLR